MFEVLQPSHRPFPHVFIFTVIHIPNTLYYRSIRTMFRQWVLTVILHWSCTVSTSCSDFMNSCSRIHHKLAPRPRLFFIIFLYTDASCPRCGSHMYIHVYRYFPSDLSIPQYNTIHLLSKSTRRHVVIHQPKTFSTISHYTNHLSQ